MSRILIIEDEEAIRRVLVKILSEENARKLNPDYFFVMPYGFINEFVKREKKWLNLGGRFILPYPEFKIVNK